MNEKYWVVASTGKIMSEPYSLKGEAWQYANELNESFTDGTAFWVVNENGTVV